MFVRGHALAAAYGNRVVGLRLEDLGECGLGLIESAELDECAPEPIAALDVVGRRFEDLGVQLDRARPVGVECGGDGLVREGANA